MRERFLTIYFAASLLASLILFSISHAQVTGQQLTLVKDPTYKSSQSQVVWYAGAWWGVFRSIASGTNWYLYKYDGSSWSEEELILAGTGDAVDVHLGTNGTDAQLYVLFSTGDRVARLTYNSSQETFTLDGGFPKIVDLNPNPSSGNDDPACITQALDGDLFIFWGSNDGWFMGLQSTDYGETWTTNAFQIKQNTVSSSLTDAISFQDGGENSIGVFIGEGKGEFSFYKLKDTDDPTDPSKWFEETLPINPEADDHVNIVKDASNNLYLIGKTGSGSIDFYLFKRHSGGSWDYYSINPSEATRPALVIDATYDKLLIFATLPASGSGRKIQYTVLDKDNLNDVTGDDSWTPVLENGSNSFNDVTVSYQILDNSSNIMVCATNISTSSPTQVWYNVLISDDALPVFMAFFNADSDVDRINLDWATHSEVNNWEWIVYRREGESGEFSEITRLPGAGNTNTITYYHYSDVNVDPEKTYYYRLANVDFDGTIHYYPEVVESTVPSSITSFALYPNYPNPFNSQTTISFEIGETANTVVDIYDISGSRVRRLVEKIMDSGIYTYSWNGRDEQNNDVASGIYILTLSSGKYFRAMKIVLSR